MTSRRKEDSKANARVVEIFASHRNAWQAGEKRLLHQIDNAHQEIAHLHARILELEKIQDDSSARIRNLEMEVGQRDDMIGFMATRGGGIPEAEDDGDHCCHSHQYQGKEDINVYDNAVAFGFDSQLVADTSKLWQDVQYEPLERLNHMKHFVPRESPWKLDGKSTRISSKLKLLEQELLSLETSGKNDISKVPSLMRKQAKRYQTLAGR